MKTFYFTATGNNLYIAKRLGGEIYSIPKTLKSVDKKYKDDKIGVVFPAYYMEVPKIVEEFLSKVKLDSKYIFAVISYGNIAGTVATHLMEIGKRNGIEFSYINEILMVDNYLPVFDIDKQLRKEPGKNIEKSLDKIIADISAHKEFIKHDSIFTGLVAYFTKKFVIPMIDRCLSLDINAFDNNFYIENGCINCGMCVKVCPADNIEMADGKPAFQGRCIHCLACTNNCPKNVIRLRGERSRARFVNQNISSKEIADANS